MFYTTTVDITRRVPLKVEFSERWKNEIYIQALLFRLMMFQLNCRIVFFLILNSYRYTYVFTSLYSK